MSSQRYSDLSELSKNALIDIIIGLQREASPYNENILSRRNRLLNEENANFREQIDELRSYKKQYYDRYQINISELKQLTQHCNDKDNAINHLTLQNESLNEELQHYKIAHTQYINTEHSINALTSENKHLADDLLRESRLHSTKYSALCDTLTKYEKKYNDLLQRYSSVESFIEEFCENAFETDDEYMNEDVTQELTKWSELLQEKQENIEYDIAQKVEYELADIKGEMALNISQCIVSDVICSVVNMCSDKRVHQLNGMGHKIAIDQHDINRNKMMMQSHITQLNGQKQIIANLSDKVKEYEHHIHRLTLQLKQLSLINKATQETKGDFNIKEIQSLSHSLMEKEIELSDIHRKYQGLKEEYHAFNMEYNKLQKENDLYHDLKNEFEIIKEKCNKLSKNQYNHKLQQRAMKEEFQRSYDNFNEEYNKVQNEYEKIRRIVNDKETKQIHYRLEIKRLKQQLFEGSNIRRELRAFIAKCQNEAQIKLNKSYKKLMFIKQLMMETFKVLNEERQFVDKNHALRHHLHFLRQKLQENQENKQTNI